MKVLVWWVLLWVPLFMMVLTWCYLLVSGNESLESSSLAAGLIEFSMVAHVVSLGAIIWTISLVTKRLR